MQHQHFDNHPEDFLQQTQALQETAPKPTLYHERKNSRARYPILCVRPIENENITSFLQLNEEERQEVLQELLVKLKGKKKFPKRIYLVSHELTKLRLLEDQDVLVAIMMLVYDKDEELRITEGPVKLEVDVKSLKFRVEFSTLGKLSQPVYFMKSWYILTCYSFDGQRIELMLEESTLTSPLPIIEGMHLESFGSSVKIL